MSGVGTQIRLGAVCGVLAAWCAVVAVGQPPGVRTISIDVTLLTPNGGPVDRMPVALCGASIRPYGAQCGASVMAAFIGPIGWSRERHRTMKKQRRLRRRSPSFDRSLLVLFRRVFPIPVCSPKYRLAKGHRS